MRGGIRGRERGGTGERRDGSSLPIVLFLSSFISSQCIVLTLLLQDFIAEHHNDMLEGLLFSLSLCLSLSPNLFVCGVSLR